MKAYLYSYKSDYGRTQYNYVVAYTQKQAYYFFTLYLKGLFNKHDYYNLYISDCPLEIVQSCDFEVPHHLGEILGEYAII